MQPIRPRSLALMAFVAISSVNMARAGAQPTAAAEVESAKSAILLVFDPERGEAEMTVRAIESHLSGAGVQVIEETLTRRGDLLAWLDAAQSRGRALKALGVFAIDAEGATELRVFFSEPNGEATLIRRIRSNAGKPRVALEEAGIVARSIVEALRDGGHVGIVQPRQSDVEEEPESFDPLPPAEATRKSPETQSIPEEVPEEAAEQRPTGRFYPDARTPKRRDHVSLTLSAVGTSWAVGEGWQLGAAVGAQMAITDVLRAQLEYCWFSELHIKRDDATFSVARHPVVVWLRYTPFAGLSPLVQAGAFADLVSRRTESATAALRTTVRDDRWMWGFASRIGMTASPADFLHVRVTGGLDVATAGIDYVVEGDPSRTLLSVRSVRPQIEASIEADVW